MKEYFIHYWIVNNSSEWKHVYPLWNDETICRFYSNVLRNGSDSTIFMFMICYTKENSEMKCKIIYRMVYENLSIQAQGEELSLRAWLEAKSESNRIVFHVIHNDVMRFSQLS